MVAGNLRKAGLFLCTVRAYLIVFSPNLADESPGRVPTVSTAANSPCRSWRCRRIENCGPVIFRPFAGLARFLRS